MKNEFNFENILVPYNASPGAEKGLEAAIEFAKKVNGNITLITCVENKSILSFFKKDKKEKFEEQKSIIENELKKVESKIKELSKPTNHVILQSSFAPETIINHVEKNNIGIVIIGQTKLSKIEEKYHESMSMYLTKGLKCPLLIVKQ
jgi:nucleotide-binding universal stress UspA family protein